MNPQGNEENPRLTALSFLSQHKERFLRDIQWDERALSVSDSFPLLGRWPWGPCYAVAAKDGYALIGNGPLVQVLSLADTGQQTVLGEFLTEALVVDIAIKDSLAFVTGSQILYVFSLARLPSLELVSEFTLPAVAPTRIQIVDTLLYVLFYSGGLTIIDVGDPAFPFVRSAVSVTEEAAFALTVSGCHAFVGSFDSPNLTTVNVCNADSPYVSSSNFTGIVVSVHTADTLLYLGTIDGTLGVYSITNPNEPELMIQIPLGSSGNSVISGISSHSGTVYVSVSKLGVISMSFDSVAYPSMLDTIPYPQAGFSGDKLWVSDELLLSPQYVGAWTVDVQDSNNMSSRSFFTTSDGCLKTVVRDGYAYIASGSTGLWILDVKNAKDVRELTNLSTGGFAVDVALLGDYAVVLNASTGVADTNSGLWVANISDPERPNIVSHHIGEVMPAAIRNRISISDSTAYITQVGGVGGGHIEVVDLREPVMPYTRSVLQVDWWPYDVVAENDLVFVASPDSGIRILDASNPDSLLEMSSASSLAMAVLI